ncbi:MAG: hypothetical protein ACKVTZ_16830 [Bacteroidia bacterium]
MKRIFSLVLSMLCLGIVQAQTTSSYCYMREGQCYTRTCVTTPCVCNADHPLFRIPADSKPKYIDHLGTNPQFGTLKGLKNTTEVYNHLKGRYSKNQHGDAAELDKLWRAMGYSGFSDASFTVDKLTEISYSCGTVGMLGAGGHKYVYATIGNEKDAGCSLKAYSVTPMNGCGISIMETCGNAFYQGCFGKSDCSDVPCGAKVELQNNQSAYCYTRDGQCYIKRFTSQPCSCNSTHPLFNIPNTEPKKLHHLGTNPQFGTLKNLHSVAEVYAYLKDRYRKNQNGDAAELDKLWNAMGYNGFSDPTFTVDRMTAIEYDCGVTGMLGAGGHKYAYSTVSEGQNCKLKAYSIAPMNGCGISIMETCGNAFYQGCTVSSTSEEFPCN